MKLKGEEIARSEPGGEERGNERKADPVAFEEGAAWHSAEERTAPIWEKPLKTREKPPEKTTGTCMMSPSPRTHLFS